MTKHTLNNAKAQKKDEFYTQIVDIEKEIKHYKEHFKGKTVFLNCDDPVESNFWRYFALNFTHIGLKKLISTHFEKSKPSYKLELIGDMNEDGTINDKDIVKTPLKQNGDFQSPECTEILKEADIVVTNPPFSLIRPYIAQLIKYEKKFLIIGSINSITTQDLFPLVKKNKLWLGISIHSGDREFRVPDDYPLEAAGYRVDDDGKKYIRIKGVRWFTNLDYKERHEDLILYKKYTPEEYPEYDNFNAINVGKTNDIPMDYNGVMGVPITFLDKYNPEQFEIVGADYEIKQGLFPKLVKSNWVGKIDRGYLNGKRLYARVLIKNKRIK